jgi:hypothetical protein
MPEENVSKFNFEFQSSDVDIGILVGLVNIELKPVQASNIFLKDRRRERKRNNIIEEAESEFQMFRKAEKTVRDLRFSKALSIEITVFRDVTPCILIDGYQYFRV